jgi:hypothetical protein
VNAQSFPLDVRHVAFAGDWHGISSYADRMLQTLPDEVQVVLHTGDFGYQFDPRMLDEYQASAEKSGVTIMFVDGNHENFDELGAYPIDPDLGVRVLRCNVWHLPRGTRWQWCGLEFLALGGAPSVDKAWRNPGTSWWPQETITQDDAHKAVAGGRADVMICHDTPAGYEIPGLMPPGTFPTVALVEADAHRELLRSIVDEVQPAFLWHGHYHSRYQQTVQISGSQLTITGLDCDGSTYEQNIDVVDLALLRRSLTARAA